MAAALSLLIILTVFVFITRLGAIALRMTGMPERVARFQCLSALSGAGYTTSESEMIVNYPVRRRIIALLIVAGNVGLLSLSATFIVSLLNTEGAPEAVANQVVWLAAAIALVWMLMLNPWVDRVLCGVMGRVLASTTSLGQRRYLRTLQVCDGISVAEHYHHVPGLGAVGALRLGDFGLRLLTVLKTDGATLTEPPSETVLSLGDRLVLYGPDEAHETFEDFIDSQQ